MTLTPNACVLLCLVLLFAFATQGYGKCSLHDLVIRQKKTGKMIQNKPEWEVRVIDTCTRCDFQFVKVKCVGFQSVTPIDHSMVSKDGDFCLLNGGGFIYPHYDFVFNYVWDTSFDFSVVDGYVVCPPP